MKTGIIYMATNTTNGKSYIGQTTTGLSRRIASHFCDSKRHYHHFARALKKYKKDEWAWNILYENIPYDKLDVAEICAIYAHNTFNTGYNSTIGGDYAPSRDPKIAARISRTKKGKPGRKQSESTRRKLSEYMKGRVSPNKGRKWTDVQNERRTNSIARLWEITCPNGDIEIIKNLAKYCRENDLHNGNMVDVSKGRAKHHKMYKCEKIESHMEDSIK